MNKNLEAFQSLGFNEVEGWCSPRLFQTIDLIASGEINKTGGVCEIGIHCGQFYILMNQITDISDKSFAIDLFNRQDLNIDYSGFGSKEQFIDNLKKYDVHNGKNTTIIEGDSTDAALNLRQTLGLGQIHLFSIDGGHTAEHTISDLHLANDTISNEGVVIIDDILNPHWLGVMEGVVHFLRTLPTLVPFAIGDNKLYFSKLSYYKYFFDLFRESPLNTKIVKFLGHNIVAL